MPRPSKVGLNVTRKKRRDGSVVEYFYDRRTGRFLGHDRESAQAILSEAAPAGTVGTTPGPATGSLAALVALYYQTDAYKKRKLGTKLLYKRSLEEALLNWGRLPVRGFKRGDFEQMKITLADTPHKANNMLRILRRVFGLAVKLDWISANPLTKPELLEVEARREIWDDEMERRFLAAARPSLQLAFILLLYTAQRPSDVLEMTRNRVSSRADGRMMIAVRQGKTGELLDIPVHKNLAPMLADRLADPSGGMMLVQSPRGLAWPRRNFSRAWDHAMAKAGLSGEAQRRDLRRTAVVRMAQMGLTTPQIAAITGHGIDYCQRIIDTYLPRRTEVAISAIEAWEASGSGAVPSTVVRLASRRPKS